jgi:hypothetical protein
MARYCAARRGSLARRSYEAEKRARGEWDAADLTADLHRRLAPPAPAYRGARFAYVYVDEVQDLTPAQIALCRCGEAAGRRAAAAEFRACGCRRQRWHGRGGVGRAARCSLERRPGRGRVSTRRAGKSEQVRLWSREARLTALHVLTCCPVRYLVVDPTKGLFLAGDTAQTIAKVAPSASTLQPAAPQPHMAAAMYLKAHLMRRTASRPRHPFVSLSETPQGVSFRFEALKSLLFTWLLPPGAAVPPLSTLTQNFRTHRHISKLAHYGVLEPLLFYFETCMDRLDPETSSLDGEGLAATIGGTVGGPQGGWPTADHHICHNTTQHGWAT